VLVDSLLHPVPEQAAIDGRPRDIELTRPFDDGLVERLAFPTVALTDVDLEQFGSPE
jgi:hypothetical protein